MRVEDLARAQVRVVLSLFFRSCVRVLMGVFGCSRPGEIWIRAVGYKERLIV